jgi:Flp pilus assembly protein TadB
VSESADADAGSDADSADEGWEFEEDARNGTPDSDRPGGGERSRSDDGYATREDVAALREDVAAFADEVEERTVDRDALEDELKRYVRRRQRRGHARGWGPYLVLGYGTAMTLGAFFLLSGGWAIAAMVVVWLSTLGLYVLFVLVGFVSSTLSFPGRLRDRIGDVRS